jgi:hypothetical protein
MQNNGGDTTVVYQYANITDFAYYRVNLNFSMFFNTIAWWQFENAKNWNFVWNISSVDSDICVSVNFEEIHNLGGLQGNLWVYYATSANRSDYVNAIQWYNWWNIHYERTHWLPNNDDFFVYVFMLSDTSVGVKVYKEVGLVENVELLSKTYEGLASGWNDNVTITESVRVEGDGSAMCLYSDSIFTSGSPDLPFGATPVVGENIFYNFFSNLGQVASNVLPDWLRGNVMLITEYAGIALNIIWVLLTSVSVMLPLLGMMLFFWFLDAVGTSVSEGSFTPVGTFASTIYGLFAHVANLIVTAFQTIYDFIHFW